MTACTAESTAYRPQLTRGYLRRMASYLADMFPLAVHAPLALLLYANLAWLIGRAVPASARYARGDTRAVVSMIALDLLIRLMDEIKDKELDARYFPERPLPAGRVSEADLRSSQLLVAGIFLALAAGSLMTIAWAAGLLLCAFALSRHLWMRSRLERSPLLTLATHSPLVPLVLLYVTVLMLTGRKLSWIALAPTPLLSTVGMLWSLIIGVEIARKTRAPHAESGYPTYSRAWGPKRAVWSVLAAATAALGCALILAAGTAHSLSVALPCLAGFAWLAGCCVATLRDLTRCCARLRGAAQLYTVVVMTSFPLEGWLSP